jgi:hypothetical protein
VVAWQSNQDGSGLGVFAKIYQVNQTGAVNALTEQILINSVTQFGILIYKFFNVSVQTSLCWSHCCVYAIVDQRSPDVVASEGGGFVITYQTTVPTDSNLLPIQQRILFQIFDARGNAIGKWFYFLSAPLFVYTRLGLESAASEETIDRQDSAPSISWISGDNPAFAIAWISTIYDDNLSVISQRAMVRIFTSDGVPITPSFQANFLGDLAQTTISTTSLRDNSFIVTWTARESGCSGRFINAQRFDTLGNMVGPQFPVSTYEGLDASDQDASTLQSGDYVVAWSGMDGTGTQNVYMQMFSGDGSRIRSVSQVNTIENGIESSAVVVPKPDGGFVIFWNSFGQNGNGFGLFGQYFDVTGAAVGNNSHFSISFKMIYPEKILIKYCRNSISSGNSIGSSNSSQWGSIPW